MIAAEYFLPQSFRENSIFRYLIYYFIDTSDASLYTHLT